MDGYTGRLRQICANADMPLAVLTASGSPDVRDWTHVERNKRRMEYAAEAGADCYMFMNAAKPKDRAVTVDDLKAAADGAEAWAEYAAQFGLELSYHIHTNLLVDSIEDWRTYMGFLDKAKLCIDVSHAQLWGYEPCASLRDFRTSSTTSTCRIIRLPPAATTASTCPCGWTWANPPTSTSPPSKRRWMRLSLIAGSPPARVSRSPAPRTR
ncbi:MAG: TIM barrel protein [Caldilineaceae bacterium]